jgi:hypothetical protein
VRPDCLGRMTILRKVSSGKWIGGIVGQLKGCAEFLGDLLKIGFGVSGLGIDSLAAGLFRDTIHDADAVLVARCQLAMFFFSV